MNLLSTEVIDRAYASILAAKTPAERIAMADSAHRAARTLRNRETQLYPQWIDEERQRE